MRSYAGCAPFVFVAFVAVGVVACAADGGDPTTPTGASPGEGGAAGDVAPSGNLGDASGGDAAVGDGDAAGASSSSGGSSGAIDSGEGGDDGGSGAGADGGGVGASSSGGMGDSGGGGSGSGGSSDSGSGGRTDGASNDGGVGGNADVGAAADSGVEAGMGRDTGAGGDASSPFRDASAGCVASGCPLKVQSMAVSPLANTIVANLNLVDSSASAIALGTLKVRYYFTADGDSALAFNCDYAGYFQLIMAGFGPSNVTGKFVAMGASATPFADTYLELSFTGATLPAGATASVSFRIHDAAFATSYNLSNDWSSLASAGSAAGYADATHITAYVSGALVWGIEPGQSSADGGP